MKNAKLNYGLIGRLLLNTELLNNTNLSKFLSQDLIDKLNKEYVEYIQTKRTKENSKGTFAFEVSNDNSSARLSFGEYCTPFYQRTYLTINNSGKVICVQSRYSVNTNGQETKWITLNCENAEQKEELYLNENNEYAKKGKMFKVLKKTREMKKPKDTHFEIEFHN